MSKKILVTGASGFIGIHLCKYLTLNGHNVCALTHKEEDIFLADKQVAVDLQDEKRLFEVLNNYQPDVIVHLAAIASPIHGNIPDLYKINLCGTENLFKAAIACLPPQTRVILASTAGVYGLQKSEFLSEELPFNPMNHYSISKMDTEILSRQYADQLSIQIIRPFNIIGSGQNKIFLIPKLVDSFKNKASKIDLGNIDAVRDYVDIDYCVNVINNLIFSSEVIQPAINICSGLGYSCRDIINALEDLTGQHPEIEVSDQFVRKNEIWRLVGDTTRLRNLMGASSAPLPLTTVLNQMLYL